MYKSPNIHVHETSRDVPIEQKYLNTYVEFGIQNQTGKKVYLLLGTGAIITVPYTGGYTPSYLENAGLRVEYVAKIGHDYDSFNKVQEVRDNRNRTDVNIFIKNAEFLKQASDGSYIDTPVYVEEFGFVASFSNDPNVLRRAHPKFSKTIADCIADALKPKKDEVCSAAPFYIMANSHNRSLQHLYVSINGTLCAVDIQHIFEAPEMLEIYIRDASGVTNRQSVPENSRFVKVSDGDADSFCIWGTDRDSVYKRMTEVRDKQLNSLSQAEVEDKITRSLEDANAKIASLTSGLRTEQERTKILAKERDNYKKVVEDINKSSKQTHEQEMMQHAKELKEMEMEAKRAEQEHEEQMRKAKEKAEREKAEMERDAAEAKRKYEDRVRDAEREAERRKEDAERLKREHVERCSKLEEELTKTKLDAEREAERRKEDAERLKREHVERCSKLEEELTKTKLDAEKDKRAYEERTRRVEQEAQAKKAKSESEDSKWKAIGSIAKTTLAVVTTVATVVGGIMTWRHQQALQRAAAMGGWIKTAATVASSIGTIVAVCAKFI